MTKVQFRNEDCFQTMQKFIDNSKTVDIILTSPPYNTARNVKTQKAIDTHNNRYDSYNDNMTEQEAKSLKVNNKSVSVNALIKYFNDIFEEGNHE